MVSEKTYKVGSLTFNEQEWNELQLKKALDETIKAQTKGEWINTRTKVYAQPRNTQK